MKLNNKVTVLHYGVVLLILYGLISGCATVNGPTDSTDPFESYNRAIYSFNESFDNAIAKPVAETYKELTPSWLNKGITNFFSNLGDVVVLANDILQLKFEQALHDSARIFFNTTVGLGGFFDVSTHLDLPRHKEDFGQTLAYWGVPSGPYFVLPFFGPSTIRDSAGLATDFYYFYPITVSGGSWESAGLFILDQIDTRSDLLLASRVLDIAALDPYIYVREAYFQRRRYLIYDGNPPPEPEETIPEATME